MQHNENLNSFSSILYSPTKENSILIDLESKLRFK